MDPHLLHLHAAAMALRGAGEAVVFGAVWALFAGAIALAWRRRVLTFVLRRPAPRRSDARNPR